MQQPLVEKYAPRTIDALVGVEQPKKILSALVRDPRPSAWLLVGPPGTGKTSAGLALAQSLPAELHHVPAREMSLEAVREMVRLTAYAPIRGRFHVVLVDEIDEATRPALVALLSVLDSTAYVQPSFLQDPLNPDGAAAHVIWIFTANSTENLEKRFLSRCRLLPFSSYGIAQAAADHLTRVWAAEAPKGAPMPDVKRIVKDACNNLRDALNRLELELMAAESVSALRVA